jgi:subtilisin family serine protease
MLPRTNSLNVMNGLKRDHGTAVLGQVGAQVNRQGMAGIAFEANLWAIQAGSDTITDHSLWAQALDFVCEQPSNGRKVIILEIQTSQGGNIEMSPMINKAIVDAVSADIVVCVPAGNGNASRDAGVGDDGLPIPPTGSIVVGATRYDKLRNIVGNSNVGRRVVVYAPGDPIHDLTCSLPNDRYRNRFGGTSGAVAKVAGAVALMLEVNPQLTPAEVREMLSHSNIPVVDEAGERVGVLLDAEQAVGKALKRAAQNC